MDSVDALSSQLIAEIQANALPLQMLLELFEAQAVRRDGNSILDRYFVTLPDWPFPDTPLLGSYLPSVKFHNSVAKHPRAYMSFRQALLIKSLLLAAGV